MKERYCWLRALKSSLILLLLLTVLCGIIYPLCIWCVGECFFRKEARGSLIVDREGRVYGAQLIAQKMESARYFHPRPSMAGPHGYDATHSSGSQLGPTSQELIDLLKVRIARYRSENGIADGVVLPAEAVTASGSGLDPHISVADAELQAERVARARGVARGVILRYIAAHTEAPLLGLFGMARVNVLVLNRALDGDLPSHVMRRES